MPLYKSIKIEEAYQVYLWKITESESWLSKDIVLTPHCQSRYDGMKSKPHLKDGTHVSITHSFEFTGIILSKNIQVGIDIEKQREKIMRIAHRFTPVKEYRTMANEEAIIRKLTMVWGAKESIYKIMGMHGLSFLNHIRVSDFEMKAGETTASVLFKGIKASFQIRFMEFEGFTLAFALREGTP